MWKSCWLNIKCIILVCIVVWNLLSLLECFNCIFKEKIYCYMIVNGICKFIDVVFFLVLGYNNIIYIVIKMCLVEINLFNVLVLVRWFYG